MPGKPRKWTATRLTALQWFILDHARDGKDIYEGCINGDLLGGRKQSIFTLIGRGLLTSDEKITPAGLACFELKRMEDR